MAFPYVAGSSDLGAYSSGSCLMSSNTSPDPAVRLPTRKEITFYYKTNRKRFWAPEQIRVLQIVKNFDESVDRQSLYSVLKQAEAEIAAGSSFAEVADKYSDCPGHGGDLGWFGRGEMVEAFEELVFELALEEISPIFETQFGLHLVKLVDRRAAGIAPLSEVYELVSELLYRKRLKHADNEQ